MWCNRNIRDCPSRASGAIPGISVKQAHGPVERITGLHPVDPGANPGGPINHHYKYKVHTVKDNTPIYNILSML